MKLKKNLILIFILVLTMTTFTSATLETGLDGEIGVDIQIPTTTFNNASGTVNGSSYWLTNSLGALDDANATQFSGTGGTLSILESWLLSWLQTTLSSFTGNITASGDICDGAGNCLNNVTASSKINLTSETIAGSACSGSDGAVSRVCTLTESASLEITNVWIDGVLSIKNTKDNSAKTITFGNDQPVWDEQDVIVEYKK